MDGSRTEVLSRDGVDGQELAAPIRVIDADDSSVTHWPCGVVLSRRFDGVAWVCPRCGVLR